VKKYSLYSLVLVNVLPIIGVLFLDWSLFSIMFFYWLESAVVGAYNIPKLLLARVSLEDDAKESKAPSNVRGRLSAVCFFFVHYGMFMLGHGLFVFEMFGPPDINAQTVVLGIAALMVSHGVSFKLNYLDHREYEKVSILQQMFAPYKRIVIMHITIILGGMLVSLFGAPVLALIFMVLVKIAIDVYAHRMEHTKLGTFIRNRVRV